jgi:photosystem II stability/assembly factor-like uncharacterized protein
MKTCFTAQLVFAVALVIAATSRDPVSIRAQQPATAPATSTTTAIDPAMFRGLRWRSIGPARGGRSQAVAGSAARPLEYYFGATGGGLWKTTDGGVTWRPVSDKFFTSSSVGAVAVSESNPDVVYVGMGETELRGNILQGDGVYKSVDGGKTFTHVGLEKTLAIARIRVHPGNPDIVYVAALGDPYGPNEDRGIFKTSDGGKTWTKSLFRDGKTGAVDLALDPKNPDVLYAGLWEVSRTPHSLSSGGAGSGLFKTTDGGASWTELTKNDGLPKPIWGKIGVTASGADSNRVYAIIEAADGGVFLSDDAGKTWKKVNEDRRLRQRAFYYTRIYADPQTKDTVYILNTGIYRSTDAGKTIRAMRVPHGDNHDLWIASNDPKRMINSNDGGANVSTNAGESWTDQDFPTAQFYNVITTAHVPYHVCGAQQDNSTACVPSSGEGTLYAVGGGESGYIAPDPADTDVFYAGSYGGLLTRINRRTGEERAINVWPDNPMGFSSIDIGERFQWTYPIVFSPTDPNTLYATSQHVWKTTNAGQSWERISSDLTRHDPATMGPSGGPITLDQTGVETYAVVFTLAPSAVDGRVIWAGSDDGYVHVTRDAGKNWERVTPPDLPDFTRISLIEASPHEAGTAYLAGNRYQRADRAPYVYKTSDYGKTWTKIVNGLPPGDYARAIREDKKRKGLLFLGTENGIYVSFDDGANWQSLRLELPVTPVHGIEIKGGRPRHRDARPIVLRHGQHFGAASGHPRNDERTGGVVPSGGRYAVGVARHRDRLLPQGGRRQDHHRVHRSTGARRPFVHGISRDGERAGCRRPACRRRSRRRRGVPASAPAGGREVGHEPFHLGHALSGSPRLPRFDHVGGQHARPDGPSWTLYGQADGARRDYPDRAVRDHAERGGQNGQRRRSAGAVRPRETNQRQGLGRQRRGHSNSSRQGSDRGAAFEDRRRAD